MKSSYVKALETQAAWYTWGKDKAINGKHEYEDRSFSDAFVSYTRVLEVAETVFMNRNFCDLVDFARLSVPDELEFEEE